MHVPVGLLRPGVVPEDVLPRAATAAAEMTTVEAKDVGVVRGRARITVRFTSDDDAFAQSVAARVHAAVAELADVGGSEVTRRSRGRWEPV
ncbi:hypothetical protein [Georgenia alba]|uniref:Asp23/Gls24 family envelope stress response protein n=1 Tax=Georgenia alba TaxID=2233858 RepID=A0ABW2Q521_9MICO